MRGKAQRVARPAHTRLYNSGVTGAKLTEFFIRLRGVIGGVNARILCGMPVQRVKVGYADFCRLAPKIG